MSEGHHNPVVKIVEGWPVRLGGEEHQGWLPPGAAMPPSTPIRYVVIDLRIELNETGPDCLLIQEARDGTFCWDSWHESVEDAEEAAREWYGVEPSHWIPSDS